MGAEAMLRPLVVARAGGAGKASSGHMPGPGQQVDKLFSGRL